MRKYLNIETKFNKKKTLEGNWAWFMTFGAIEMYQLGRTTVKIKSVPHEIKDFFSRHIAIAREVKPFLSKYPEDFIKLEFKWKQSPRYGLCMTATKLTLADKIIDCESRCFRTHAGNKLSHTSGCWIFSDNLTISANLNENQLIAQQTSGANSKYHQLLKEFDVYEVNYLGEQEEVI